MILKNASDSCSFVSIHPKIRSTDGKTWATSTSAVTIFGTSAFGTSTICIPYSITWNGKRFIAIGGNTRGSGGTLAPRIAYSYDAITWYTAGITPTASQLFTASGFGLASSAWPTLGSVYVDNAVTLSSSSGLNTNNQLDVYSDTYFNNGYNNMAVTIKSTQIP
jgi:hypothetical protein